MVPKRRFCINHNVVYLRPTHEMGSFPMDQMGYAKYEDGQIITTISGERRLKTFCIACDARVHFVKQHMRKHPTKTEKSCVRAHFRHSHSVQATEAFLRQHRPESIEHIAAKKNSWTNHIPFQFDAAAAKYCLLTCRGREQRRCSTANTGLTLPTWTETRSWAASKCCTQAESATTKSDAWTRASPGAK